QAPNLSRLVRQAGRAGPGADARPQGRRARRPLDDLVQSRDDDARAARRARARGRLRPVPVRAGQWNGRKHAPTPPPDSGQAAPRDNVVFEAGLFGGVLGMRRTFILHARGSKLPTDLLGLTSIRYDEVTAAETRVVCQKLRKVIEDEGRLARIEGLWWQFSLTERSQEEPSALSLLRIGRDRDGAMEVTGRSWQEDGKLSARYWSEATKEKKEPSGVFYYWRGER